MDLDPVSITMLESAGTLGSNTLTQGFVVRSSCLTMYWSVLV